MPVLCREYDLLFTHVPRTGGRFVTTMLTRTLGGQLFGREHMSYRQLNVEDPPSIRVFTVRQPVDWYRSYWACARASVHHPHAWPMWEGGDVRHPTRPLDDLCGHHSFAGFVQASLRHFPDGFLRSVYCDFLNGATHTLRTEHLHADLEKLLELVGYENPGVAREMAEVRVNHEPWKQRAVLPASLEAELREVENLVGLDFPSVGGTSLR